MGEEDKALMAAAYDRLILRANLQADDEPYLLFGMMAMENEMLMTMVSDLKARLDRLTKPKLIVPEMAPKLVIGSP